jgi:hypothetical protein
MKVGEIGSLIETEHPELLRSGHFRPPTTRCAVWVVVRKPPADRRFFEATIKAQAHGVAAWAANHAKNSWSSSRAHQEALEFMVEWLAQADLNDGSTTIPNRDMLAVLEPYAETFIQRGLCRFWCPKCASDFTQDEIKRSTRPALIEGSPPANREQWLCGRGHLIYDRTAGEVVF